MVTGVLKGPTTTMLPRSPEIVMGEEELGGRETGPLLLGHSHSRKRKGTDPCEAPPGCKVPCEVFDKVPVRHAGNRPLKVQAWPRQSQAELGFPPSLFTHSLCCVTEGVHSNQPAPRKSFTAGLGGDLCCGRWGLWCCRQAGLVKTEVRIVALVHNLQAGLSVRIAV